MFEDAWRGLLDLCLEPLTGGGEAVGEHARVALARGVLAPLLNAQDAVLQPYLASDDARLPDVRSRHRCRSRRLQPNLASDDARLRDVCACSRSQASTRRHPTGACCLQAADSPLEEALATFSGRPGGPAAPAWQLRPPAPPQAEATPRVPAPPSHFPQPVSLSAALCASQVRLFSRVFALVDTVTQTRTVERLTAALAAEAPAAVKARKKGEGSSVHVPWVCACALLGLSAVARARKSAAAAAAEDGALATAAQELGMALLAVGGAARAGTCPHFGGR